MVNKVQALITTQTKAVVTLYPTKPQTASAVTHSNSAEEGLRTDWEKWKQRRRRQTGEFEINPMKELCGDLPSSNSNHRHIHVLTLIHTCRVHWNREEAGVGGHGGGMLAARLGLKPITNTRISSHVHTAF